MHDDHSDTAASSAYQPWCQHALAKSRTPAEAFPAATCHLQACTHLANMPLATGVGVRNQMTCPCTCDGFPSIRVSAQPRICSTTCSAVTGWGPLFPIKSMRRFCMTPAEPTRMLLTGAQLAGTWVALGLWCVGCTEL
jgi:hypothetical protein